ncbi:MAG TPA: SRPBCC family protein [Mycobacteriales bacterium]|nr:SRPBCC family protein [Mycobacteriales bacterium]
MWGTTVTAATAAAPDAVWPLLADPARWREWDPDIESVSGTVTAGGHVRTRTRTGRTVRLKVTAVEPGRSIADRQRLPLARVRVTRSVDATQDGSAIHLDVRFTGVLGRLWWRVVGGRVTRSLRLQARNLADAAARSDHL